jgi:hypothetical protein
MHVAHSKIFVSWEKRGQLAHFVSGWYCLSPDFTNVNHTSRSPTISSQTVPSFIFNVSLITLTEKWCSVVKLATCFCFMQPSFYRYRISPNITRAPPQYCFLEKKDGWIFGSWRIRMKKDSYELCLLILNDICEHAKACNIQPEEMCSNDGGLSSVFACKDIEHSHVAA